jgi:hypothetical protein
MTLSNCPEYLDFTNIPTPFVSWNVTFLREMSEADVNPMYRIAQSLRAPPPAPYNINESAVRPERWEDPSYRVLPSGATVSIAHAHKQEIRLNTESRTPFGIESNPPPKTSRGLKRVKTITKSAGLKIKQRRREEKENFEGAVYYANAW